MSIPKNWQEELAVQKKLRAKLAVVERKHRDLVQQRVKILKAGGLGWARELAKVNVAVERTWEQVRKALLKLYSRTVIV